MAFSLNPSFRKALEWLITLTGVALIVIAILVSIFYSKSSETSNISNVDELNSFATEQNAKYKGLFKKNFTVFIDTTDGEQSAAYCIDTGLAFQTLRDSSEIIWSLQNNKSNSIGINNFKHFKEQDCSLISWIKPYPETRASISEAKVLITNDSGLITVAMNEKIKRLISKEEVEQLIKSALENAFNARSGGKGVLPMSSWNSTSENIN